MQSHVTRQRIADESGTSPGYVQRAERYAKGVDAAEEVLPGIKKEILSGSLKATDPEVAAIAKTPPEIRRQKTEELRIPKEKTPRKAVREELQAIRKIAADMRPDVPPAPTSEDSILETLHGAVTDMIRVCNTLFSDFPRLLADSAYKTKVIEIMDKSLFADIVEYITVDRNTLIFHISNGLELKEQLIRTVR